MPKAVSHVTTPPVIAAGAGEAGESALLVCILSGSGQNNVASMM